MGCDIHPYLEVKLGDEWLFVGRLVSFRNYTLFGKLSGVRREEEPQFFPEERRIPEDASCELKVEWAGWEGDGHSITVCSYKELKKFCDLYRPKMKDLGKLARSSNRKMLRMLRNVEEESQWQDWWGAAGFTREWLEMMEQLQEEAGASDVRVVLWYDN